jgi:hypothetical protein
MSLNRNSMSNINLAYQTESSLGQQQFQQSTNPSQSRVIPNNFNQQLVNKDNGCQSNSIFSNLSGQSVNQEGFHNNMVPFFRGQVKQNVSDNTYNTRLESFTGVGEGIRP